MSLVGHGPDQQQGVDGHPPISIHLEDVGQTQIAMGEGRGVVGRKVLDDLRRHLDVLVRECGLGRLGDLVLCSIDTTGLTSFNAALAPLGVTTGTTSDVLPVLAGPTVVKPHAPDSLRHRSGMLSSHGAAEASRRVISALKAALTSGVSTSASSTGTPGSVSPGCVEATS